MVIAVKAKIMMGVELMAERPSDKSSCESSN
jgi:hypothetical protein